MQSQFIQRLGLLSVTAIGLSLSACSNGSGGNLSGTYVGDYSRIEGNTTQAYRVTTTIVAPDAKSSSLTVSLKEVGTGKDLGSLEFDKDKAGYLLKSTILEGRSEVKLDGDAPCFDEAPEQSGQSPLTTLCVRTDTISLFSTDAAGDRVLIYMSKYDSDRPEILPANNGVYGLDDLFQSVLTTSYDTRIATEKLYQAQQSAEVIHKSLYPNITAAGFVSLIYFPLGATNMMGQLVPFIFPTTWFAWNSARYTYESQVMAYRTLIANQMNLAEDLYHQTLRDSLLVEKLQDFETSLEKRRAVIALGLISGVGTLNDLTDIDGLIYKNKTSLDTLQIGLTSELDSLSIGIGLSPRNGIKALKETPATDFSTLQPLVSETLMAEAKAGSLDLRQVMLLGAAASADEKTQEWSVINPAGWLSLDASIINKINISKSNTKEIQYQQTETENSVEKQVRDLTGIYNQVLTQNIDLSTQLGIQQKSLDQTALGFESGIVSMLEYHTALEALIQMESDQIQARSTFEQAQGKIDRLLWIGSYAEALTVATPSP